MITNPTAYRIVESPYHQSKTVAFSDEATVVQANYIKAFQHFTHTITSETFYQKFQRLSSAWKADTLLSSSSYSLLINPSYLAIISMGQKVLPYIFEDLKKSPSHWFMALAILTGANPISEENRGDVMAMTNSWLEWAKKERYVA